jgi:pimeloyl-ACP methyl ester carboxylesterase
MTAPAANSRPSASALKAAPLWKWGVGAAAAAGAATALFNAAQARKTERAYPPIGDFVEVEGVRLHYLDRGTGPLIVLLHGNGTMIEDWLASGVFDALAVTNRVIAFDRPGFGHTNRPRSVIWTPPAQARILAAGLTSLGAGPATIVGHSFATQVALSLALEHPETVAKLVLLGGYYYPSFRPDVALAAPPAIPVVGDAMRYTVSPLLGQAMRPAMERQVFGPAPVSEGWRERFPFAMTLRPSQIRAAAADAAIMVPAAAALAPRLAGLTAPVTIIAGKDDRMVDAESQSGRLAEEIGTDDLLYVEGSGHMVHHSATETVVAAIARAAA